MNTVVQEGMPGELCPRWVILQHITTETVRITVMSPRFVKAVQFFGRIKHCEVISSEIWPRYSSSDTIFYAPKCPGSVKIDPYFVSDAICENLGD